MSRISKTQAAIVAAHLEAIRTGNFDVPEKVNTREDAYNLLTSGKTIKPLAEEIASRYVSITSQLMASQGLFGYVSEAYKRDFAKGFKVVFNALNIN
jgi:hypothetical protein